jgi:hypothetical protein
VGVRYGLRYPQQHVPSFGTTWHPDDTTEVASLDIEASIEVFLDKTVEERRVAFTVGNRQANLLNVKPSRIRRAEQQPRRK